MNSVSQDFTAALMWWPHPLRHQTQCPVFFKLLTPSHQPLINIWLLPSGLICSAQCLFEQPLRCHVPSSPKAVVHGDRAPYGGPNSIALAHGLCRQDLNCTQPSPGSWVCQHGWHPPPKISIWHIHPSHTTSIKELTEREQDTDPHTACGPTTLVKFLRICW